MKISSMVVAISLGVIQGLLHASPDHLVKIRPVAEVRAHIEYEFPNFFDQCPGFYMPCDQITYFSTVAKIIDYCMWSCDNGRLSIDQLKKVKARWLYCFIEKPPHYSHNHLSDMHPVLIKLFADLETSMRKSL